MSRITPNAAKTKMIGYDKTSNKKFEVGPYFEVVKLIKKLPENIEPEEIEIKFFINNAYKNFKINIEDFCDINTVIKICFKNYFIFDLGNKYLIYEELTEQLKTIINNEIFSYEHKCLGWQEINNKNIFLYDKTEIDNNIFSVCTRTCGKFINGDEQIYDDMLNKYILTNPKLSLAYIMGFSGVISSRLSQEKDLGVLIVGLSGRSTTGKTTALKLMASIWGCPDDAKGSLIMRNNASEIGFISQYSGLFGVPILFDDLDTNSTRKIDDFLYSLATGSQRIVATQKGEVNYKRMGFSGISIITSETPLLDQVAQKSGLYARIIDFSEFAWTNDGLSANEIKGTISQNYGFKGKKFAEFIQKFTNMQLSSIFKTKYNKILNSITQTDAYTDRIAKHYAVSLTTLELVNQCFGTAIDEEAIKDIIFKNEYALQKERNKAQLAYEYIYSYYQSNKAKFDRYINNKANQSYTVSYNRLGIAIYKNENIEILIPNQTLKTILSTGNFNQLSNYKKVWLDKNYIKHEKGRYDNSSKELGRHYHFVFSKNEFEINNEENNNEKINDEVIDNE